MYNPGIRASFLLIGVTTESHKIKNFFLHCGS